MNKIVILNLDPGTSATIIAEKIKSLGALCETKNPDVQADEVATAKGFILNGSPLRIIDPNSLGINKDIYQLGIPILGICYGQQLIARDLGGEAGESSTKTFDQATLLIKDRGGILTGLKREELVWMHHNDEVKKLPEGFKITAYTKRCRIAVMENREKKIYGLQFHPENDRTLCGMKIFRNFIQICGCGQKNPQS